MNRRTSKDKEILELHPAKTFKRRLDLGCLRGKGVGYLVQSEST